MLEECDDWKILNRKVDATLTFLAASALICMSVKFNRGANNEIILKSRFYHKKKSIHEALPTMEHTWTLKRDFSSLLLTKENHLL